MERLRLNSLYITTLKSDEQSEEVAFPIEISSNL